MGRYAPEYALGNDWVVQEIYPMYLDFSGLYFGTYLKLGR